ncbi:MAG: hypothetical protein RR633_09005 [Acinetobacter sp.]
MNRDHENLKWELSSGVWLPNDKGGFKLLSQSNLNISNQLDPYIIQQLLNLPTFADQMFPVEFKYHPETGEPLTQQEVNIEYCWLGAYGNNIDVLGQAKGPKDNGLQLSKKIRSLTKYPNDPRDAAVKQIDFKIPGRFEFLSVCVGTLYPQLIALNKINGSLYLLNEKQQKWELLDASSLRLAECPAELLQAWQAVSFFNKETKQHELYLPTSKGLACLTIKGFELSYEVKYISPNGICLSHPVYWNKRLIVPMFIDQQVKIVDALNNEVIHIETNVGALNANIYFEKSVYDSQSLIWVGKTGQLILHIDTEHQVSARFEQWLPNIQPDFRFGAPYLDGVGKFYQLCQNNDDGWVYIELNSNQPMKPIKSAFRFTTGRIKYSFEKNLPDEIWAESSESAHNQKIMVPLIEDEDTGSVLGFRFEEDSSQSIISKLDETSAQDIVLFLDSHNHHGLIHRVSVKKPLESRFFYHRNALYFYNPSLHALLGWKVQA